MTMTRHSPADQRHAHRTEVRAKEAVAIDAQAVALAALGWLLADQARADRLLALTGLAPDDLRAGLGDPAVLGAVLDFLCAHEPDLLAAAAALSIAPQTFGAARERLAP